MTTADCCLVLMMKAAARSKRRLAAEIGERATEAAQLLYECALEDLTAWPGPVCIAPAESDELALLAAVEADAVIVQRGDNLGERINHVNDSLCRRGIERQIFIGIDCPSLGADHLTRAAAALIDHDTVFGPADDGGVVLMGVRHRWPDLTPLPWSTPELFAALARHCRQRGLTAAVLEPRADVDTLDDLMATRDQLTGDPRPARRALRRWLETQTDFGNR